MTTGLTGTGGQSIPGEHESVLIDGATGTVGDELRSARTGAGQALKEIAGELRIRADHLEALEAGNLERLPGRVYALGFLRSYADYLGCDSARMVARYSAEIRDGESAPPLVFPIPVTEARGPSRGVVLTALLVLLTVLGAWSVLRGGGSDAAQAEAVAPDKFSAFLVHPRKQQAIRPLPANAHRLPVRRPVTLVARADVWLRVGAPGREPLFEGLLAKGREFSLPAQSALYVAVGNAGAVAIRVDGSVRGTLGELGAVVKPTPVGDLAMWDLHNPRSGLRPRHRPRPR